MATSQENEGAQLGETVMVYRAGSSAEAMVIRGLLESAGIKSPPLIQTDPNYPYTHVPTGFPGGEVLVREPDVEEARRIIDEYLASSGNQAGEPSR